MKINVKSIVRLHLYQLFKIKIITIISDNVRWPSREDTCESQRALLLHSTECKEMYLNSRDATASEFPFGF